MPSEANPTVHTCACGGHLRWETRESIQGSHWLAFCDRDDCGRYMTSDADDALEEFLLAGASPHPYRLPWVRTYFQSCALGHRWVPHQHPCRDCDSQLLVRLTLERLSERPADPIHILLCLGCGRVSTQSLGQGVFLEAHLAGSEWHDPGPQLRLLKQTIRERATRPDSRGERWNFDD
jgi:hypothetical protein